MFRSTRTDPDTLAAAVVRAVALALVLLAGGCGGEEDPEGTSGTRATRPGEAALSDVLRRERVSALASKEQWPAAFEELRPLLEREDPALEDLIRSGQLLLEIESHAEARAVFERALGLAPDDPRAAWGAYGTAREQDRLEDALGYVRRVLELAPDDYPARLALASTLDELDRHAEAAPVYAELVERGLEEGGSWYASAVYRYHWCLVFAGLDEREGVLLDEFARLQELGIKSPTDTEQRRGSFGRLQAPPAGELDVDAALWTARLGDGGAPTRFVADAPVRSPGITGLRLVELRDPVLDAAVADGAHPVSPAPLALLLSGPGGLRLATRARNGTWSVRTLLEEPVTLVVPFDVDTPRARGGADRDAQLDLVVAAESGLRLLLQEPGDGRTTGWRLHPEPLLAPGFAIAAAQPVDFDHEGDLDLFVVGPAGVRLLRNDGVPAPGAGFVDVTAEAGLPSGGTYTWCAIEDLDADADVDLLFGGPSGAFYAKSERGGRFTDASSTLPATLASPPVLADVDRDGRVDLVAVVDGRVASWANRVEDRWEELDGLAWSGAPTGPPAVGDLGEVDRPRALWPRDGPVVPVALRALVREDELPGGAAPVLALGDFSGDGVDDLVRSDGAAFTASVAEADDHCLRVALQGTKDNRRGVGAVVELRAGPLYQRWFWDGRPRSFALGTADGLDVLRVTWPNGVVQTETDLAVPGSVVVKQREGLVGSCPFLYAWNGREYEFISDVLGITPLGLPIDRGRLVPPDHDEFVLVRGDQLAPRGGFLELQVTEELREVTYLDRVRLDVVDHPAGVEVQPNERFTFPPFPEPHVHTLRAPLAPTRATDQAGRDWTASLATADEELARPFETLHGQFLGLAEPHHLELSFEPAAVAAAARLRLVMTGWLYWTDASVNVASADHPTAEFVPPLLWVPDGEGGWTQAGPPLGFPAGKLKTMVVDVTDRVRRDDPRLRVSSTLALYWDAIRLAVDDDDAPLGITALEPVEAELWERGFSEPLPRQRDAGLDWFAWDTLATTPRWDQHPGTYTRLGPVLPLLTAIDDRYVVMGSGDALRVRFPASELPPLPEGWRRDYLLFLDGWAKDRDPNSHAALYVEPLPFHGMSAYPYPEDETFPDTPEHRNWRRDWNTRPARTWIERLAPSPPR